MNTDDVIDLLTLAAVYDQRTVGDADVHGWHLVATAERWTPAAAQRAIVDHYRARADQPRVTPAAITDRIRALRAQAAESFEAPVIPADLPASDYPAWLRARLAEHVDSALDRWAGTGEPPARALPAPPEPIRTLPQLVAAAPAHLQPELAAATARVQARRPRLDPDRRAEAIAELDAARRQDDTA